jgi:hypothetical protein
MGSRALTGQGNPGADAFNRSREAAPAHVFHDPGIFCANASKK